MIVFLENFIKMFLRDLKNVSRKLKSIYGVSMPTFDIHPDDMIWLWTESCTRIQIITCRYYFTHIDKSLKSNNWNTGRMLISSEIWFLQVRPTPSKPASKNASPTRTALLLHTISSSAKFSDENSVSFEQNLLIIVRLSYSIKDFSPSKYKSVLI